MKKSRELTPSEKDIFKHVLDGLDHPTDTLDDIISFLRTDNDEIVAKREGSRLTVLADLASYLDTVQTLHGRMNNRATTPTVDYTGLCATTDNQYFYDPRTGQNIRIDNIDKFGVLWVEYDFSGINEVYFGASTDFTDGTLQPLEIVHNPTDDITFHGNWSVADIEHIGTIMRTNRLFKLDDRLVLFYKNIKDTVYLRTWLRGLYMPTDPECNIVIDVDSYQGIFPVEIPDEQILIEGQFTRPRMCWFAYMHHVTKYPYMRGRS